MPAVLAPAAAATAAPLHVVDEITLARVPAWPVERALRLLANADWRSEVARLFGADDEFRTAVLLATSGLRFAQRDGALDERAAVKLLAYAARMATRTTPFGLFASVGAAGFGTPERAVAPMRARRARANLGFDALVAGYDALLAQARAGADGAIVFVRASAVRRDGARFVLADERKTVESEGGPQYRNVSIRISEPIAFALERAAQPTAASELSAALAERFGVPPERARSLLDRLADARFLVPASYPLPTDDALARLRAAAGAEGRLAPLVAAAELAARDDAGALPDLATVARRGAALDALATEKVDYPLFFDATHGPLQLPERVRADAVRLADALLRCGRREHLDAYRKRFLERYESGERWIPLLDLVAPTGIGIPGESGFDEPGSEPKKEPVRRTRLAALIGDALARGQREIALREGDWDALAPPLAADVLPPSLEVAFDVVAPSYEAIERGAYRVVPSALLATNGGGRTAGRFAKYQDEAFRAAWRSTVADGAHGDVITAEPLFTPPRARVGNVLAHPLATDAVIPINVHADGVDALPLDDILVGIEGERIALRSRSRGARIHVVWPTAYNPRLAPPLARFFYLVARDGLRTPGALALGDLGELPFVPRIALGRVVLRPAAWTVPVAALRAGDLAQAAAERGIDRYVSYAEADNVVVIDTQAEAGAVLLRDRIRRLPADGYVRLQETFLDEASLWLRDDAGARYRAEIVASVASAPRRFAAPRPPAVPAQAERRVLPGGDWTYLKLYANPREFRSDLAPRLRAFAQARGAAWFYVLYRDPEWHVRFRLHGADGAALLADATGFARGLVGEGVVDRFALDTYVRELERYGGPAGMALCEQLFHLDSVAALDAAPLDTLSPREKLEALARPALGLIGALTTPAERAAWVASRRPAKRASEGEEGEVVRAVARETAALLQAGADDPAVPLAR
ncbi:MAG: lantibiotic biosynthesis protein, partial [Candidatus Eremiobacteraeota bacterium]|nr:lantibiotic biosynthesis protein [Candidatus Eremiobacteraeota bacterium]